MHKQKRHGFTLVELIVVITILAILGTIAFISLQGYSKSSRDSSRISDISSMKTSLELFQIDAGKYPVPTEGVDVTYSGAVVWNQGTFGEITFTNVAKLDRIPTDPLTDSVYTYSVTSTRNKYQIGGILEGDPLALNTFETANAGTVEGTALISGTYNGQATKTLTGTTCDMLAVPSIIANDLSETTDVVNLINSGSIAYNGFKNLPNSFKSSKFKHDGGFAFTPNKIVAYSDTGSCAPLLSGSDFIPRVTLLKGLQDAYSGTIVSSDAEIARILNITIDINTPSEEVKNLAGNFVNNNLGGKVVVSTTPSKGCTTQPSYSGATFTVGTATSINQPWQSTNENEACYWTCGAGNILLGEECVLENCSGTTPDGTTKVSNATSTAGGTWSYNQTPGVCTYECNTGYHTEDAGATCVSDTQSCAITNGTGEQTWGGSSWGICTVTSCDAGFFSNTTSCESQWSGDSTNGYLFKNTGGVEQYPLTCKDLLDQTTWKNTLGGSPWNGTKFNDGVYWIKPNSNPAFKAYCDMTTDNGGRTRVNSSIANSTVAFGTNDVISANNVGEPVCNGSSRNFTISNQIITNYTQMYFILERTTTIVQCARVLTNNTNTYLGNNVLIDYYNTNTNNWVSASTMCMWGQPWTRETGGTDYSTTGLYNKWRLFYNDTNNLTDKSTYYFKSTCSNYSDNGIYKMQFYIR